MFRQFKWLIGRWQASLYFWSIWNVLQKIQSRKALPKPPYNYHYYSYSCKYDSTRRPFCLQVKWLPEEHSNSRELIRDQRVCNGDLSFDGIDKLSKRMCFGVKSVLVSQYLLLELKGRNAPKKNNRNKDNPSSARHERVSLQVIHPNWLEIIGDSFM